MYLNQRLVIFHATVSHVPDSTGFKSKMKLILVSLLALSAISSGASQECLPDVERIDCHPDLGSTEARCLERGCIRCPPSDSDQNVPHCYFPTNWGYRMVGEPVNTGHGFRVQLERTTTSTMFGGDANELVVEIDFQSDYRLRVKITDDKPRWEVPLQINPPGTNLTDPLYDVEFENDPIFAFKIIRKETGTVLLDSSLPGFTFSDQFIQIGFKVPSTNVYGIGENEQPTFRHSFESRPRWTLYARDQAPDNDANMYGVQPTYTVLEDDGNAHAVAIINSNAMEFEMHSNPAIVFRTIGGLLDLYVFVGPTPENTAQQLSEAIGRLPLPPYWALGFHLCRYGYDRIETLKATVDRMIAAEIPYDVQYGDIDIMHNKLDFTVSHEFFPGLGEYVRELKTKGVKFVTILDPAISTIEPAGSYRPFELGEEMDVWMKRADGTPARGTMWSSGPIYYPDYSKNSTREWWRILINEFHEILEFDALWIDMNEPTNFGTGDVEEGCATNVLNNPPYLPRVRGGQLAEKTVCPDNIDSVGTHYDTHSLYGWFESEPTFVAVKEAVGKRTFALSRSTYLGSGRWLTHWLGDNYSRWSNLHKSIIGILSFNLFGMPFVGPDICGHFGDVTAALCERWQQLGAFYPFSRNHNGNGFVAQDPAAFDGAIVESSKKSLNIRYTLLPYLYTLLARHEKWGDTVARPMWNIFPMDTVARGVDRQFFWGSGLMITPVLEEGATSVEAYFPDSRFYDYYTGEEVTTRGNYTVLDAPLDHINLHIHGGNIIPSQVPAVNTDISRNNPFGLIVALDDNGDASGSFYFDDGEAFDPIQTGDYFIAQMDAANKTVNYVAWRNFYPGMATKIVDTVRLLGVSPTPTTITVNGVPHSDFTVRPSGEVVVSNLNLQANADFILSYD